MRMCHQSLRHTHLGLPHALRPQGVGGQFPLAAPNFKHSDSGLNRKEQSSISQRDPEVFLLAEWFFGRLGYQGQKNTWPTNHFGIPLK